MVPVAVVIVLIIVTSGGGSKKSSTATLPKLVSTYQDQSAGISARLPKGWTGSNVKGVAQLKSADSSAIMALGAFPVPSKKTALLEAALKTVVSEYSHTSIKRSPGNKLAGLPAQSAVVSGQNKRGQGIRVLLASAGGHTHAYLLELFTSTRTPTRDLLDAQAVLFSLKLTG